MEYYRVKGVSVRLDPGAVAHLTDAQVAARRHQVSLIQGRPDVYTFLLSSTFKRGELFGCETRPSGEVEELPNAAFEERIQRERTAFNAWKAAELAKRKPVAVTPAALPGIRRRRAKAV